MTEEPRDPLFLSGISTRNQFCLLRLGLHIYYLITVEYTDVDTDIVQVVGRLGVGRQPGSITWSPPFSEKEAPQQQKRHISGRRGPGQVVHVRYNYRIVRDASFHFRRSNFVRCYLSVSNFSRFPLRASTTAQGPRRVGPLPLL